MAIVDGTPAKPKAGTASGMGCRDNADADAAEDMPRGGRSSINGLLRKPEPVLEPVIKLELEPEPGWPRA